ncbi:MAG: hypothetical protein JEZ09_05680 [Salinivirgaceae bacterium]|nr:hypothetical protein [Salinivirgaceae bacterium]
MQKATLFLLIIITSTTALFSQNASLQLFGNETSGYGVNLIWNDKTVSCNEGSGEFSLIIENADRSFSDTIHNWKASSAIQNKDGIKLSGQYYLKTLMTFITVEVDYYMVNANVIKKEISLEQNNIPLLFYQIENKLNPCSNDVSYWSFDHLNHQGGAIREIYPAAGFFFEDSIAVGLLTDAGYRNQWTRNIRKRPTDQGVNNIGFQAVQTIADVNLYRIANNEERTQNNQYVSLTFGELSDYNSGEIAVLNNSYLSKSYSQNGGNIKALKDNNFLVTTANKQSEQNSGIKIPFTAKDGFYTIKFNYKAAKPLNLRLFKSHNNTEEVVGFHYKSGLPASADEWLTFEESVLLQGIEGSTAQLLIESKSDIEIKNFEILEISPKKNPYHRMPIGEKQTKTIVMFVQKAKDIRDIRLASQTRLAEGLGFKGSDVEKVLYADLMMLTWISGANDFSPHNVPSINYAPDMYNRDSFWSIVSVYDKDLNESVWKKWGGTQDKHGAIGTIITPYMGSIEKKGNEATCEWIWWALINKRRFNSHIDTVRLKKALEFCYQEFDPDKDGIVSAHFSLSQNDVVYYKEKMSNLAVNQGVYAITLRAAKELGFDIEQEYINKAVKEYRNFYDKGRGYIVSDKDFPYVVSFTDLMPEFMSWWLWNTPLLDSEMVINTLNKVPVINDCSPVIFHVADTFFTQENKPFLPEQMWPNGQYYNGGSWMRNEICAYVVGKKHGWEPAKERIEKRMLAEINLNYNEPFSHEIIPMDLSQPNCWWPSARVFSWNVFTLIALEVGEMREK